MHSCDVFLRRLTGKQMLVVHGARDSVIPISHSFSLARVRNNLNSLLGVNKYGKIGALVSQISENHCMSKPEFTISDAPSSEMQMEQINLDSFCSA